jgi:hypothetical protein
MAPPRKRHVQQELTFKTHGGKRDNAGRPPAGERSSEPHKKRPDLKPGSVLLITLRATEGAGNLRRSDAYHAIRFGMYSVIEREKFRITHISIQRTHVHLIVEADSKAALADGLRGFQISAAKRLNATILVEGKRRRGAVFGDRYHQRLLASPTQVRNAIAYVVNNWRRHREDRRQPNRKVDPYSSGVTFHGWRERENEWLLYRFPDGYQPLSISLPRTWLLRVGWMKAGGISVYDVPGPKTKASIYGDRNRR